MGLTLGLLFPILGDAPIRAADCPAKIPATITTNKIQIRVYIPSNKPTTVKFTATNAATNEPIGAGSSSGNSKGWRKNLYTLLDTPEQMRVTLKWGACSVTQIVRGEGQSVA